MSQEAIPPVPAMTEDAVLNRAAPLLRGGLRDKSYDEIVCILSTAMYVHDLCVRVLEDRGQLEILPCGHPVLPCALPDELIVDNILTRGGD